MRRTLHPCSLLLCAASLAVSVTTASASHVAPVLPLTSGSNHSHEKFAPTVFPPANLSNIDLSFADLTNCVFSPGTNLTGANFTGANLTNCTLAGCTTDLVLFRGANLSNAALPCMGGSDFRGAVLTGANGGGSGCSQCGTIGPNAIDQCTTGALLNLCLASAPFRGVVAGVVFDDANVNGVLDFGEAGLPGVQVTVTAGGPAMTIPTDGRGGYVYVTTVAGPAMVTVNAGTLPAGWVLNTAPSYSFDTNNCRSGQGRNFGAHDTNTSAKPSTFGRLKMLYR